jgi:CRP/FNR family transcriptional regulator, cyclic AMP receptor protein
MVIEISEEVIALVAPYITDHRLRVVHGDALKWMAPRGLRWNVVWHDIWDDICADNLNE